MKDYVNNVDGKGHSMSQFAVKVCRDALITGWGGILVDMPDASDAVSVDELERLGLYAYMTYYTAEDIINYNYRTSGRLTELEFVILKEKVNEPKEADRYSFEEKEYYRVLELDDDGFYVQTLYNDKLEVVASVSPKMNGDRFRFIPFAFTSSEDYPSDPMLLDLVNVNLSHYRKSADIENGAHITGVPTPWGQGFDPEVDEKGNPKPFKFGGTEIKYLPSGASLSYLEFNGGGCNLLTALMDKDEERMATLGARIIAQQRKGVEAAETAKIHNAAENSVLAEFANMMSSVLGRMLRIYLSWSTSTDVPQDEVSVKINTDYDVSTMSPQEIATLVSLWQSRGIAKRDLFRNLQEGEVIEADRDFDEMNAEIEEEQGANLSSLLGMNGKQ